MVKSLAEDLPPIATLSPLIVERSVLANSSRKLSPSRLEEGPVVVLVIGSVTTLLIGSMTVVVVASAGS